MTAYCGIYGYGITRVVTGPGFCIEPRTNDYKKSKIWTRDTDVYHLTAVISGPAINNQFLFDLEAVLSFIEHLDVIITAPQLREKEDVFSVFPPSITAHKRNSGGGAALQNDTFNPEARARFIVACLEKLADESFCTSTMFRSMLFKKIETFRQRQPFLDISYFLLYSGLESYARAKLNDVDTKNSSVPISKLLQDFGFDVAQDRPSDLPRAMSTYAHLRNAVFHNGELEKTVPINNIQIKLRVTDYFSYLSQLLTLVILKAVEFDDGHINWNSWMDRQPFK